MHKHDCLNLDICLLGFVEQNLLDVEWIEPYFDTVEWWIKTKMHVCKEVFVDLTAGGIHEFEFQ